MLGPMGFQMFNVMFTVMFVLFIVVFVVMVGRSLFRWNRNNHSPRLTVAATVVAKRQHVSRRNGDTHRTSSSYYVTFQVESGDRMEFHVDPSEYGMLVEGDRGQLTFQGTRYLSFQRK